jgi:MYXO-CTERM domain-containing protein
MKRGSLLLSFVLVGLFAGGASPASANGGYSHVHISQLAVAQLPPGELRDLFADPEMVAAVEAGSMFPDSGYAAGDPYGEITHWEPFLVAYLHDLDARYAGDLSSREAKLRLAFMLGFAGHALVDQSYDTTLLERAYEMGDTDPPDYSFDQLADYFLTIDQGIRFTVDAPYAPYADLPAIIADGPDAHVVTESVIHNGMDTMSALMRVQSNPRIVQSWYLTAWEYGPFLGTHYYDELAVGSVRWLAPLLVAYWRVLWERAHGTDVPTRDLLFRSVPADGGTNWNVDLSESRAWGRISLFFGYAIDRPTLEPLVTLRDSSGTPVPTTFESAYGCRDCSLVHVVPGETLAYDTTYTVELASGATTLFGETTDAPISFSFRTRCAPDRLGDCPPLPPPLVVGPMPERDGGVPRLDAGAPGLDAGPSTPTGGGGCGCRVAQSDGTTHGSAAWLAVGALAALGLRRRSRRGLSRPARRAP